MQKAFAHTGAVRLADRADDGNDPVPGRRVRARRRREAAGQLGAEQSRCATAKTRTRRPRGCRGRSRPAVAGAPGQGAVVHEPARSRRRARIVLEFSEPAATVIKHTNPCGTATGATIAEAYVRARDADPLSAFGGIVGLNRADRRRDGDRAHLDVHRGGDRAVDRRRRARDPREEGEHARADRRFRVALDAGRGMGSARCGRSSAAC